MHVEQSQGGGQIPAVAEPVLSFSLEISYKQLWDSHSHQLSAGRAGRPPSTQVLKNQRSHFCKWLKVLKLDETAKVGGGLDAQYLVRLAEYVAALRDAGLKPKTIRDHVNTINRLRDTLFGLRTGDGLPRSVSSALRHLMSAARVSRNHVAKAIGVKWHVLDSLTAGRRPTGRTLDAIPKLEKYFNLTPGTLSSRLLCVGRPVRLAGGETAYRRHLAEMRNLPYTIREFPSHVTGEWDRLALFHTDPEWVAQQGLDCGVKNTWRVRLNRGYSATERLHRGLMRSFFGFLMLPTGVADPRLRGEGFDQGALTIALLSDAAIVAKYIEFRRARSFQQRLNNSARIFLYFCTKLLAREHGYLWQHPELGARLPAPVAPERWHSWCDSNRSRLIKLRQAIFGSAFRLKHGRVARDPFAVISEYVRGRQHPVTALWELAGRLESRLQTTSYLSPLTAANLWRNLLLVRLLAANPFRGENMTGLTYIPARWEDLWERDMLWLPATEESNFYQTPDGAWWVRIEGDEFKRARGLYDVPVPRSLWGILRTYLFQHRPVINHAILKSITECRGKHGLVPFNDQQKEAVLRCGFMFRFAGANINRKSAEGLALYKGTEQPEVRWLSGTMLRLTRLYLPGCKGFSPHACRHLVATEKMKNDPAGAEAAAAALNIETATVKEYYAWVTAADKLKPWSDHHEKIREKWEQGKV